jgi:hypothetical protein
MKEIYDVSNKNRIKNKLRKRIEFSPTKQQACDIIYNQNISNII